MTADTVNLRSLPEENAAANFPRAMIGFAAQRLMDLEVGSLTGAGYGEKGGDRLAQRNGYRKCDGETRAGTTELRIPCLRTGSYCPASLEPRHLDPPLVCWTPMTGSAELGGFLMASTTKRRFTDEFKALLSEVEGREAVALWEKSGRMQTEVAAGLGIMPTMPR